ncbi:MAG TPA: DoxX family protein [Flavisolibacter sp.]|nr:DoxX family protein [Flavisolibacter sp.]
MKRHLSQLTNVYPSASAFHYTMLFFRVAVSVQLMVAHGLKKIGVGVLQAEVVPNPLHLPEAFNHAFAIASNLIFPCFIILGLFTRLACLGVLVVTLTGYFLVHWHDSALQKDAPYMYSAAALLILFLGAGKYSCDFVLSRTFSKKVWS